MGVDDTAVDTGHEARPVTVSADVSWKPLKDGVVLLHVKSGFYYTLNDTAAVVWRALADEVPESQIVADLVETYEVEFDEARLDVESQIDQLLAEELLQRRASHPMHAPSNDRHM